MAFLFYLVDFSHLFFVVVPVPAYYISGRRNSDDISKVFAVKIFDVPVPKLYGPGPVTGYKIL